MEGHHRARAARERLEIENLLDENPSLRASVPDIAERACRGAVKFAASSLAHHGKAEAARRVEAVGVAYTPDQLRGDWFP